MSLKKIELGSDYMYLKPDVPSVSFKNDGMLFEEYNYSPYIICSNKMLFTCVNLYVGPQLTYKTICDVRNSVSIHVVN